MALIAPFQGSSGPWFIGYAYHLESFRAAVLALPGDNFQNNLPVICQISSLAKRQLITQDNFRCEFQNISIVHLYELRTFVLRSAPWWTIGIAAFLRYLQYKITMCFKSDLCQSIWHKVNNNISISPTLRQLVGSIVWVYTDYYRSLLILLVIVDQLAIRQVDGRYGAYLILLI